MSVTSPVEARKKWGSPVLGAFRAVHSLRVRLPLLISALIISIVAAFQWATSRELQRTVLRTGEERAQAAAEQIASLVALTTTRGVNEARRVAGSDVVRGFLQTRTDQGRLEVQERLGTLATTGQPWVDLLDASGHPVVEVRGAVDAGRDIPTVLRAGMPSHVGVGPFRVTHGVVWSEVVIEVTEPTADLADTTERVGFLVVRRTVSAAQTLDLIGRLVGTGALVAIGNQSGDVWTNLSVAVSTPPLDVASGGIAEYTAPDGQAYVGRAAVVDQTPWSVWVGLPRDAVLAPARAVRGRMLVIGSLFVVISAVLATGLSARITTPLAELARAAESIAAGQYSKRVTAQRDEIGRLGAAFNTMADRIEEAQRVLEARVRDRTASLDGALQELDQFFSLSLDLFCIASTDGFFKRVSPAWTEALGWTAEELTAVPYTDFVHPDDVAATRAEGNGLSEGRTTVSFENRYRCKDGSYRWLSWKAAALPERGLVFAAARDVTERKRIARELQHRVGELKAVNQELEAFTYSVSHDLRAPLRHITGFAALLERSAATLDDESRRRIGVIVDAANRMGRLIDDLLAFSRAGRAALAIQHVPLGDMVRDARKELPAGPHLDAVRWTVHPLPHVDADPAMLRLVFVNLLDNALKYTRGRSDPSIEIGTNGGTAAEVVVFVRDNGVGFDMQYAHKLFGVFQRLHSSEAFEGTGIGLANVQRIIHRHGGRTWAEGEVDRGATFYFSLPILQGGLHA